jgi:valyl-tRNA synthetase
MRTPTTQLDDARNFLNKLWNVTRFALMNLGDERPERPETIDKLEDRFILSRLSQATETVCEHLDAYTFNLAAEAAYSFVWHDFCDWYVELIKPRLRNSPDDGVKGVLYSVLRDIVKLLHPIVPHITEEIWQVLGEEPESVCRAAYPAAGGRDEVAEREMQSLQEVIAGVRTIRADLNVPAKAKLTAMLNVSAASLSEMLNANLGALTALTGTEDWSIGEGLEAAEGAARKVLACGELFVDVADMIDVAAETARLHAELASVSKDLAQVMGKLTNEQFLKRAPADVVEKEQHKRDEFTQKKERLDANLASLGG